MKKVLLILFTLSMMLVAATAHANLITNGDFSDGLNGWDITHPHAVTVDNGSAIIGHAGIGFGSSSISQNFYIAPGTESLDISFDLTFSGHDWNLIAKDVAKVVLSTLHMESFLWWNWEEWADYNVFQWGSNNEYTTISVNSTMLLSPDYLDKNPNGKITFMLDESLFGIFGWLLDTTMSVSNVNISPTGSPVPVPAAVWLLGSGLAGMAALRRKMN